MINCITIRIYLPIYGSFNYHGSGEVIPVTNDLMPCNCIGNECISKCAIIQQQRFT